MDAHRGRALTAAHVGGQQGTEATTIHEGHICKVDIHRAGATLGIGEGARHTGKGQRVQNPSDHHYGGIATLFDADLYMLGRHRRALYQPNALRRVDPRHRASAIHCGRYGYLRAVPPLPANTTREHCVKGLPVWILATMVGLTAILLAVGWHDRHHAGYLPFILGVVFAIATLASIGAKIRFEDDE